MTSLPDTEGLTIIEQARQHPPKGWEEAFTEADSALEKISRILKERGVFYPMPNNRLFHAFRACPLEEVKVVIVGAVPYLDEDDAFGLSFSTPPNRRKTRFVEAIYKELQREYEDFEPPFHGCLLPWTSQGVLLLNACLVYHPDDPMTSTERKLFMPFMRYIIDAVNAVNPDCVYLLWGDDAKQFQNLAKGKKIFSTVDPNPFTGSKFIGCNHFKDTNEYLVSKGKAPIDWCSL